MFQRAFLSFDAGESGKQCRVYVHDSIMILVDELWAEDSKVACKSDETILWSNTVSFQGGYGLPIVLRVHLWQSLIVEDDSRYVMFPSYFKRSYAWLVTDNNTYQLSSSTIRDCQRSEEHTSELQSQSNLVCRLLLEKKKINIIGSLDGILYRNSLKANQTGKKFRVGIKSNISTNRNNLISGVDRCLHLNEMKKTTITSINRQTIKI